YAHKYKLFTAIANRPVAFPAENIAYFIGKNHKTFVTNAVAKPVVQTFEMVYIEYGNPQSQAIAIRYFDDAGELVVDKITVFNPCQSVGFVEQGELGVGFIEFPVE